MKKAKKQAVGQAGRPEKKDDPGLAMESGEPGETRRSHGQIIDQDGKPTGHPEGHGDTTIDLESGRHDAI